MKIGTPIALGLALLAIAPTARADVKLPAILSDHMVLQRDMTDPVFCLTDKASQTRSPTAQAARSRMGQ